MPTLITWPRPQSSAGNNNNTVRAGGGPDGSGEGADGRGHSVEVQFNCDKADHGIVSIVLGLDDKFCTILQQYAMRVKLDAGSLRFLYDGMRIENMTPADLELHLKAKEDCMVDVVVEQTGG